MRINVDGYALRDPRHLRLAKRLGIPRQFAMGKLLDVWAVCYDRVSPTLSVSDIDTAAEHDGFAEAMCDPDIDVGERTKSGAVLIRGAQKRLRYLTKQKERGRAGGKSSGKSRTSKQTLRLSEAHAKNIEATTKPSGSGSGSGSGSCSGSGSGSCSGSGSGSGPASCEPAPVLAPLAPEPAPARVIPLPVAPVQDPDPRTTERRGILRRVTELHRQVYERVRLRVAPQARPMAMIGDPAERALLAHLVDLVTLENAEADCQHVLAIREAEALRNRSVQFLGASVWSAKAVARALAMTLDDAEGAAGRYEPPPDAARYGNGEQAL